ncbi:hypothetical protein DM860_009311 [Cuscuta australis]|uniref:Uncharacterized protein n=1 Tax=Cuscuta australis TaxID=267555 RepID=A0A328DBG6_9ASTE|nr:hypothetical protein DM860_009311 [Cuscuta australis]
MGSKKVQVACIFACIVFVIARVESAEFNVKTYGVKGDGQSDDSQPQPPPPLSRSPIPPPSLSCSPNPTPPLSRGPIPPPNTSTLSKKDHSLKK